MFQISTQYEGKQYTVELHSLVLTKLNREDLYRALVRHNVPGIEKHHGQSFHPVTISPCHQIQLQRTAAVTVLAPAARWPIFVASPVGFNACPIAQLFYRATLICGSGFSDLQSMSALPPKADIETGPVVSFDAPTPAAWRYSPRSAAPKQQPAWPLSTFFNFETAN